MAIQYLNAKRIRGSSVGSRTLTWTFDLASATGSATNGEVGTNWVDSAPNTGCDISGGTLNWQMTRDTGHDNRIIYDLGSALSDTAWVLRYKLTIGSDFSHNGDGNAIQGGLMLTDLSNSYHNNTNADSIGLNTQTGGSSSGGHWDKAYVTSFTAGNEAPRDGHNNGTDFTREVSANDVVYVEIIRTSATSVTFSLYSDSSYSTLIQAITESISSAIGGLRYIRSWMGGDDNAQASVMSCKFDDIQIWDGVTSATQDEKATLVTTSPKCATFDGSNDKVTYSTLMSGTGAWSFSVWVYHTGGTSGNDGIVSANSNGIEQLLYQGSSQKFGMKMGTNSHIYTATTVAENTWYHLAGTRATNGDVKFYLNGAETNTASGDTGAVPTGDWVLGACGSEFWAGSIIEWAVWNGRVLSSSEVSTIYNSGSPTRLPDAGLSTAYTTNLTGYYPLDTNFNKFSGTGGGNGTNSGTLIEQSTPVTPISASSDLPENTLFEETNTRFTYFLQSGVWENSKQPLNMTYANSTLADAVWVSDGTRTTGEGIIKIDTTNNYLKDYWDSTTSTFRLSQNTYDLGSSLGTTWTVQFTVNFSNWRDPTSSNYVWGMGMWGSPSSTSINTSQDRLVCFVNNSSAWTIWDTSGATASGDGSMGALRSATGTSGSPSAVPSASTNSKDWFVTLQKVDATKYTVVVREDSHTGTIIGARKEQTWQSGTPSGFRYFGAKCTMSNSARTGMIIKDVLVYDGALVGSI